MTPSTAPTRPTQNSARERFQRLVAEWKEQSRHLSNTAQMAMLKPYQRIIGMGESALPLILEEMQRQPDHWFWALEAITQENPVQPEDAGRLQKMTEAWLAWARERGVIGS